MVMIAISPAFRVQLYSCLSFVSMDFRCDWRDCTSSGTRRTREATTLHHSTITGEGYWIADVWQSMDCHTDFLRYFLISSSDDGDLELLIE